LSHLSKQKLIEFFTPVSQPLFLVIGKPRLSMPVFLFKDFSLNINKMVTSGKLRTF
jgi:hypothetical protein